jgi:cysteine-rich repeat protein
LALIACGDNRAAPDASMDSLPDAQEDALVDAPDAMIDAAIDAAPFCGDGVLDPDEECDTGLRGLSNDGCSSTCGMESLVFSTPTREMMLPRARHSLAYDVSRERTVMFGGERDVQGTRVPIDETWEYDGASWQPKTPTVRPSARTGSAMFYEDERTILFGGSGLADTWAWDGTTWSLLTVTTTPTGAVAGAAYDRQRSVGVLVTLDGTWEWNGDDWSLAGPGRGGVISYAGAGRVAAIGSEGVSFWNGTSWASIATARWATEPVAATYDPARGRLLAVAYDLDISSFALRVFEWTGSEWAHLPSVGDAPVLRRTPFVFDEANDALVMFGGGDSPASGRDTWTWDGTWHQRFESLPPPRHSATVDFDTRRGSIVMFGGVGQSVLRDDTWAYRSGAWTAVAATTRPEARINYGSAFDEERGVLVVYGGQISYWQLDQDIVKVEDLWELDGTTWTRRIAPAPIAQEDGIFFRATYDRTHHYTMIVTPERTLTWDGTNLVERTPPPTPPGSVQFDAKRGVTVLSDSEHVYEWTGALWLDRGAQGAIGPMVYDPNRATMIIWTFDDGLWEWNGSTTTRLTTSSPYNYYEPPIYDRSTRSFFRFGPTSGWDTNVVRWESDEAEEQCDGTDTDLDGLVRCDDPDCWWRCTPRCPPYASCDPAAPHCGDNTCSELEDVALCPSDCS